MSQIITKSSLLRLADKWLAEQKRVIGPRSAPSGQVLYAEVEDAAELSLAGYIRPANSIKDYIFPRHEKLYSYKINGRNIELIDAELSTVEQVFIGARPCDAAAMPILDRIFNWDCSDDFFNRRRELSTIITFACKEHDDYCFCTSVNSGPEDSRGSDVILFEIDDEKYEVRSLTDKGKKLFDGNTEESDKISSVGPGPEICFDLKKIKQFLDEGFESPLWKKISLGCIGCGVCTYTCPTCHCFDIVDEGNSSGGERVRNWDSCQFSMFTKHASGHNPRSSSSQRGRQRIYHKFQIYPEKFGKLLCTGCGNCSRDCPVSSGVKSVLQAVQKSIMENG